MAQANLIIIRIRAEHADEFERLFADEELVVWRDLRERAGLRRASLTRIAFGTEEQRARREGYVPYGIYAEFDSMAGHSAHDDDPRFNAFLAKARTFQPSGPSVWGGETVFTEAD